MKKMKIGIAGCGGIGSNVAYHLTRLGLTNLKFGDYDIVEKSNLNRQFFFKGQIGDYKSEALVKNLERIEPLGNFYGEVICFNKYNIGEFFDECDIVVEAFDSKENKVMLIEELLSRGKTIISASGIGGYSIENIVSKKVNDKLVIVGDFINDTNNNKTYSHKVSAVSCVMVQRILEKGGLL